MYINLGVFILIAVLFFGALAVAVSAIHVLNKRIKENEDLCDKLSELIKRSAEYERLVWCLQRASVAPAVGLRMIRVWRTNVEFSARDMVLSMPMAPSAILMSCMKLKIT